MLISIIIPIYNVEKYIEACLDSIYQQTYPNIEIILINDCTTDNSIEKAKGIINKYNHKFPTSFINHEQNKGLSEARNSGMKIAKGEYIYFIDSDDEIAPTAIESLAKLALNYEGVDLVEGKKIRFNRTHKKTFDNSAQPNFKVFTKENSSIYYLSSGNRSACNTLFRRKFIQQNSITFSSGLIYEDNLFRYQVANYLSSSIELNQITYFHRENNNSLTMKVTAKHIESLYNIISYISQHLSEERNIRMTQLVYLNEFLFTYWTPAFIKNKDCHQEFYTPISKWAKNIIKNHFYELKKMHFLLLSLFIFPYKLSKRIFKIRNSISK